MADLKLWESSGSPVAWVIAETAQAAQEINEDRGIGSPDDGRTWREMDPDEPFTFCIDDPDDEDETEVTKPVREWVEEHGRGFFAREMDA